MTRAVVIGAGLAGLAAARTFAEAGVEVVVVERGDRPGGRLRTHELEGAPVDVGAQFVAPFCTQVLAAVRECGLDPGATTPLGAAVVDRDGAHPLSVGELLRSDVVGPGTRARLLGLGALVLRHLRRLDPHDFARAAPLDTRSALDLALAHGGTQAADRLLGPTVRGLLYWDLETTTQAMTLVMLRVAWQSRRVHRVAGGLGMLPAALAARLDLRTGSPATGLQPGPGGGWVVELGERAPLAADLVVCATTASAAARLLREAAPQVAEPLDSVTYSRTAVLTYRVPGGGPDSSLLFATGHAPGLAAVTPVSDGLVRVYLSDEGAAATADLADDEAGAWALDALAPAGCDWAAGARLLDRVLWDEALPRFEVGSLQRRPMPAWAPRAAPGLALAGDYLGGPMVDGAWLSGRTAARLLLGA